MKVKVFDEKLFHPPLLSFTWYAPPLPPLGLVTVIVPVPPLHEGLLELITAVGAVFDNVYDTLSTQLFPSLTYAVPEPTLRLLNTLVV